MDLFDLVAKITLDSTAFEKGLQGAKTLASGMGSAVGGAFKIGAAAIGAATTAVAAFGADSVKTGAEFDKTMSQVGATMLKTSDEMAREVGKVSTAYGDFEGNLRDFAQFLGSNTAFSATEAAEALNYMALAGYNTQESMEMLPNVLSLAAAGGFDLARASDMVTDAQTAFGITAERTTQMVDEMAKAASTGNTSVEQLGDAFLVVGGLAKELNGGYVGLADGTRQYVDGVQELEIALTAMANAGIKGSEAGTHMRNMLLKLSAPTSDGAATLEKLGVAIFDTDGKMRSLSGIFTSLNYSLENLTQEEKIQAISEIFNARDVASAEALLAAVGQDWDNIGEAILNADGAAADMAKIQLDNLAGDVTLFKSALEGAKIVISDSLSPSLREFVQFGTDGVSKLSQAFKEGGLSGAIGEFGSILGEGLKIITKKAPEFVKAGTKLITSFIGAFTSSQAQREIRTALVNVISEFVGGMSKVLPQLLSLGESILMTIAQGIALNANTIVQSGLEFISQFLDAIIQNVPILLDAAAYIVNTIVEGLIENAPTLIQQGLTIITSLMTGIYQHLAELLPAAVDLIITIAEALIDNIDMVVDAAIEIVIAVANGLIQATPKLLEKIPEIIIKLVEAIVENAPKILEAVFDILISIGQALLQYGADFVSKVVQNGKDILTALVNWLSELPEKMAYWAGYAIGAFIKFFMELPEKIKEWLTNTFNRIKQFGEDLKNKAPEIARNFREKLIEGIRELPQRFREIGENIINGIWNGISAGWDWLIGKVRSLAQSLLQGAKDALGIASPSKAFAKLGLFSAEGFGVGFEKEFAKVKNDIENDLDFSSSSSGVSIFGSVNGGRSGGFAGGGIVINVENMNVRNDSDIRQIAKQLYSMINHSARSQGLGGVYA